MLARSKRPTALAAILAAAILALPSIALAGFATSGNVYRATVAISGINSKVCIEASVTTNGTPIVMNGGATRVYDNVGGYCDGTRTLGVGWIGVTLDGYKNGAFCGTTGYQWNSSANYQSQYYQNLCTNPAGSQSFNTNVFGRVYNGAGTTNIPGLAGPSQND